MTDLNALKAADDLSGLEKRLISEIERLTAENEALRVDAGRYQPIREGLVYIEHGDRESKPYEIYVAGVGPRGEYCQSPEEFDAFIDAMKGQTP